MWAMTLLRCITDRTAFRPISCFLPGRRPSPSLRPPILPALVPLGGHLVCHDPQCSRLCCSPRAQRGTFHSSSRAAWYRRFSSSGRPPLFPPASPRSPRECVVLFISCSCTVCQPSDACPAANQVWRCLHRESAASMQFGLHSSRRHIGDPHPR